MSQIKISVWNVYKQFGKKAQIFHIKMSEKEIQKEQ